MGATRIRAHAMTYQLGMLADKEMAIQLYMEAMDYNIHGNKVT